MIDISKLSGRYKTRILTENDVDMILDLCRENTLFYEHCEAKPSREQVISDMTVAPPDTETSDKYFFGFFEGDELVAFMDIIDGYPSEDIAYIGLFMVNVRHQGKQLGTVIVDEVFAYLKAAGKRAVRLAIDKGNPQSTHFWRKNGFGIIGEADVNGWTKLVAERIL